jgi:DNA polymerase/3'-5' exonuclease PolX
MSDLKFMLAKEFMKGGKEDVTGWLISEKFDGYRACYDHDKKHFFSRQNKPFNAPEWFIQAMPPRLIDGELWIGRDMFQEMGTVRKKIPVDEEWFNITFQVYDMPDHPGPFVERLKELKRIVKLTKERWNLRRKDYEYPYNKMACPVVVAKQVVMKDDTHLESVYQTIIKEGGEGIMLKDPNSPYEGKRSNYLLKYKPNFDAEAVIVGYKPGQGKYQGHLGGFICKPLINHDTYMSVDDNDDHGFSISGMDDEVRKTYQSTHPLGTIISYEHSGKTDKGKPRFPRYTRIRTDVIVQEHIQEPIMESITKVIAIFTVLGNYEKNNGHGFKASAYFKAIKGIHGLTEINESSLKSMKGIGPSLSEKIMCIVNTGTCPAYEKIKDIKDAKAVFLDISGVGPKKAGELVAKGFTSIEALRKEPTLKELLNEKQRIGLTHYEDILERIPQAEIDLHDQYLKHVLHTLDATAELTIAGSYRRRAKDSGDIDVLLKGTPTLYKTFIAVLEKDGYLYETLAKGPKKYNGMSKLANHTTFRRIDIMITKPEEYPFAILYFTGSKDFNTLMRQHALDRDLTMNEYSLKHVSDKSVVDHVFGSEVDIFDYLEYPYVEPWLR